MSVEAASPVELDPRHFIELAGIDEIDSLTDASMLYRGDLFVLAAFHNCDFAQVRLRLAELDPLVARIGDLYLKLRARYFSALLFDAEGYAEKGETALRETLTLARSVGSPVFVATVQSSLAIPLVKQGRARDAEALLVESVPVLERAGKAPLLARSLMTLSLAVLWRSHRAEASVAATHASRALAIFERAGSPYGAAVAADCLGMALFAQGRPDEAQAHFERAAQVGVPTVESDAKVPPRLALNEAETARRGGTLGQRTPGDRTRARRRVGRARRRADRRGDSGRHARQT